MRRTGLSLLWVLPPLWIVAELLSGQLGSIRFPWLGLGTSLTHYLELVQPADLVGAGGIGWLLVLANLALGEAWLERSDRLRRWRFVGMVGLGILACLGYGQWRHHSLKIRLAGEVVIVQPNIGYREKWDPARQDAMLKSLIEQSEQAVRSSHAAAVFWPEMAVPDYLDRRWGWEREILDLVSRSGATLIFGGLSDTLAAGIHRHFNAALTARPRGTRVERVYRKRFLVPLLESNPFRMRSGGAQGVFGGYSAGDSGVAIPTPLGRVGILICFESAFEQAARSDRKQGAELLVNLSNDAWLGPTSGPDQNAVHLVLRAIENRAGIVRAANTGPSLIIDPFGHITQQTRFGTRAVLTGIVTTTATTTVFDHLGDWVNLLLAGGAMLLLSVMAARRRRC